MNYETHERKLVMKFDSNRVVCCLVAVSLFLAFGLNLPLHFGLIQSADAARFILRVEEEVYTPGESLVIYGAGANNDILLVTLFDASGRALRSNMPVKTDSNGFFREAIYEWQQPTTAVPFGSYTVEAISNLESTDTRRVEVAFAEAIEVDEGPRIPVTHTLGVKLDSPAQVAVNEPFRIFIQATFDGALIAAEESEIPDLLGSSHIHLGNLAIPLREKLQRLHEGLYFADVTLDKEGTYIIHSAVFHRGLLAHDSKVITATSSSIGTIQESITELDLRLDETNEQLENLQQGIQDTRSSLNDTQSAITDSVEDARISINTDLEATQQATGQINSLILPVLALISVIIALQISLFARIRASFR
jgi:hypothetical protein